MGETPLIVRFWGTRGSVASAGQSMVRYGGNTSCVQIEPSDGTQILLDIGTGARALGGFLLGNKHADPLKVNILITHSHWDHIQGFPFFGPVYLPGTEISVYGPAGLDLGLEGALSGQMQHTYFPVHLSALGSRLRAHELGEGVFTVGDVRVRAQYMNHTAPTLGYRLEFGGVSVVYATDHEPFWWGASPEDALPNPQHPRDRRHPQFLEGADLLIHDSQYTDEEYPQKRGWGHSTIEYVVDMACLAGVKRLVLFHHDPDRSDAALGRLLTRARRQAEKKSGGKVEVIAAAEGLSVTLAEQAEQPRVQSDENWLRHPITGRRVAICAADPNELVALNEALSPEGHVVRPISDQSTLMTVLQAEVPELVLVALGAETPDPMP